MLLGLDGGGMARFELPAGGTSAAVYHRSVEEIWYVLEGRGELWRRQEDHEEIVALSPGLCVTLPLGTRFQFRAAPDAPLAVLAVTLPPWPGAAEALPAEGPWPSDAT